MHKVDILDVFFVHLSMDGHTLLLQQRQEVKRGRRQGHLILRRGESTTFSLPTNHSSFPPPRIPQKTLLHQITSLENSSTKSQLESQGSNSDIYGWRWIPTPRSPAPPAPAPPSPAPWISLERSLSEGWKLLKSMNTSQEILTLNICRLASASSAV